MTEQWKPVVGYEGFYEVSSVGRVRSVYRRVPFSKGFRSVPSKILTPANSNGYLVVTLNASAINKRQLEAIHRMVAAAFICPKPSSAHQVNHIDGNKHNNCADNLEWTTPLQNIRHNVRRGTAPKGDTHGSRKLSSSDAENIRSRAKSGESGASLAREFGITKGAVYHIVNGRTWKHVEANRD